MRVPLASTGQRSRQSRLRLTPVTSPHHPTPDLRPMTSLNCRPHDFGVRTLVGEANTSSPGEICSGAQDDAKCGSAGRTRSFYNPWPTLSPAMAVVPPVWSHQANCCPRTGIPGVRQPGLFLSVCRFCLLTVERRLPGSGA